MFGNTIAMMNKSMDYLWKKQEIIADNIANVDTPGYKKKSVDFEQTFREKLEDYRKECGCAAGNPKYKQPGSRGSARYQSGWKWCECGCGICRAYKDSSAVSIFSTVDECRYYQISVCY